MQVVPNRNLQSPTANETADAGHGVGGSIQLVNAQHQMSATVVKEPSRDSMRIQPARERTAAGEHTLAQVLTEQLQQAAVQQRLEQAPHEPLIQQQSPARYFPFEPHRYNYPSGIHDASTEVQATTTSYTDQSRPGILSSGVPGLSAATDAPARYFPLEFPRQYRLSKTSYQRPIPKGQLQQKELQMVPRGPFHLSTGGNGHPELSNETLPPGLMIPRQAGHQNQRPSITNANELIVKTQTHESKPIHTTVVNEQKPALHKSQVQIKRLDFEGKSMACLIKDGACYALLEALLRVFFPYVNMDEFRYEVEMVLSAPVMTLTDEEEQGFIKFYGLPTEKLNWKKAIKLRDFSQYLPQLRYMYRERAEAAKAQGPVKK